MKILQICSGFDIAFNGGITNYVRNISDALVDNGHDVTVLYSKDSGVAKNYKYKTICIAPVLEPFHLSSVISNGDIEKIEKIILREKPDIIHVHMMIDLPTAVLAEFKKYAKLVISLHDYSYICNRVVLITSDNAICKDSNENKRCNFCIDKNETIDNRYLRFINKKVKKVLNPDYPSPSKGHHERFMFGKKLFHEADAVIAVSSRVKEIYQANGYSNPNFIINHIGNYTAEDNFRKQFVDRRQIPAGDNIKFGFIGNLIAIKGSGIFLELFKNSTHEFHIYGGIDDNISQAIANEKNVFYHGKYKHEDLSNILKNVDIGLVLPVWEDNAPQVVFEFLNAGIPIVGTRMGGLPDFINDSNGFLFDISKEGINEAKSFIGSNTIYEFYNHTVNNIQGTKKAGQHACELIEIYTQLLS